MLYKERHQFCPQIRVSRACRVEERLLTIGLELERFFQKLVNLAPPFRSQSRWSVRPVSHVSTTEEVRLSSR